MATTLITGLLQTLQCHTVACETHDEHNIRRLTMIDTECEVSDEWHFT